MRNVTNANISVRTITMTALLSAIAYILAFVEFPIPLSPAFARMDFSDFPALIGAFAFGPIVGTLIELVKNTLQLLSTSTGGIGEFANFLMGASFVFTAGLIYQYHKRIGTINPSKQAGIDVGHLFKNAMDASSFCFEIHKDHVNYYTPI